MGGFWVRSDLDFRKKVRVFNWGGVFWVRSDFESRKKVIEFSIFRWEVFWVRSDLESRKKVRVFNLGGVFWVRSDLGLWEEFHFGGGGGVLEPNPRTGCSGEFGQKFLEA